MFQIFQHLGGGVAELLACRRQLHPPGRAVEQAHSKISLQILDGLRQCRLGGVEALGGEREAASLRHGEKALDLLQGDFHGALRHRSD